MLYHSVILNLLQHLKPNFNLRKILEHLQDEGTLENAKKLT